LEFTPLPNLKGEVDLQSSPQLCVENEEKWSYKMKWWSYGGATGTMDLWRRGEDKRGEEVLVVKKKKKWRRIED